MRFASLPRAWILLTCLTLSCKASSDTQYVLQKVPIEIQRGTPATIGIRSLSGNGWNEVGIRCSPEIWKTLSIGANDISVRLKSSGKGDVKIINISPGSHKLWPVDS